jgi:hypothetical protein
MLPGTNNIRLTVRDFHGRQQWDQLVNVLLGEALDRNRAVDGDDRTERIPDAPMEISADPWLGSHCAGAG